MYGLLESCFSLIRLQIRKWVVTEKYSKKTALSPTNRQTTVPAVSAVYPNGEGSIALVFPSIKNALRPFTES